MKKGGLTGRGYNRRVALRISSDFVIPKIKIVHDLDHFHRPVRLVGLVESDGQTCGVGHLNVGGIIRRKDSPTAGFSSESRQIEFRVRKEKCRRQDEQSGVGTGDHSGTVGGPDRISSRGGTLHIRDDERRVRCSGNQGAVLIPLKSNWRGSGDVCGEARGATCRGSHGGR